MIYHGSYTEIREPKIIVKKWTRDFGYGFYCTLIREQAERWALKYSTPIINTYNYVIDTSLNMLEFKEMSEDWLDFIVDCRNGKSHNYDIVVGAMADDQIYNYISEFLSGSITREQFWVMMRFKYPTHQICFCTEKALKTISFVKSEIVYGSR